MKKFNITRFSAALAVNIMVFASLTAAAINSIPEKVYVAAGEKTEISFDVPLTVEIEETVTAINVTNAKGEKTDEFNLSTPFYVDADEETSVTAKISLLGIPVKTVDVDIIEKKGVVPCGNVVGVTMDTNGILVLGTGEVVDENGEKMNPAKGKIYAGDVIFDVNGKAVQNKEELAEAVKNYENGSFTIGIKRRGRQMDVNIKPVKASDGYKIGVWVRDSTQGLGTVTYFDSENGSFAALGHGIYDVDTGSLMEVKNGNITHAEVTGYAKGEKGTPGEIMGSLDKSVIYGDIEINTEKGLYGSVNNIGADYFGLESYPVGMRYDIKEGKAYIKSDILKGYMDEYEIEIESVDKYGSRADKSMVIRITDERLINETGGIIQGMSGSPIIQNGKLIGAVTHVLVNDPTRGYGIFIENMMETA